MENKFEKLLNTDNHVYFDKTLLIEKFHQILKGNVVKKMDKILFIQTPSGTFKSTNNTMLKVFFDKTSAEASSSIFRHESSQSGAEERGRILNINKSPNNECFTYKGKFNVIHLDFSDIFNFSDEENNYISEYELKLQELNAKFSRSENIDKRISCLERIK